MATILVAISSYKTGESTVVQELAIGTAILVAALYGAYMLGLIFVLKRMRRLTWHAFVPFLNYYAEIRAINAPARWFLLTLPPYLGFVYAAAVAIRLGRVFGRNAGFSLTWLIIGAPIGMFVLAFGKHDPDPNVLSEPAMLLDLKELKKKHRSAE